MTILVATLGYQNNRLKQKRHNGQRIGSSPWLPTEAPVELAERGESETCSSAFGGIFSVGVLFN